MLEIVSVLLLILALFPALVALSFPAHVAFLFRRQRRRAWTPSDGRQRVSIIVPLRGADSETPANLRSIAEQRCCAGQEILFCVEDQDDPAMPALREIVAEHQGSGARLLLTGPPRGSLGKMHHLLAGLRATRGEVVVFVDADVRFPDGSFVETLRRPLAGCEVGLVTCYPAYRATRNIAATLLGAMIHFDLLGCFALLGSWSPLRVANGACLAIRRETLEQLGGLETLRRQMLMDSVLAERVHELGREVRLHEIPVPIAAAPTLGAACRQVRRWHASMRYALSASRYALFCWLRCAVPLALTAVALAPSMPAAAGAGFVLGSRLLSAMALGRLYLRDPLPVRSIVTLLITDPLNAIACLDPVLFHRTVVWRGRRYGISKGGTATVVGREGA